MNRIGSFPVTLLIMAALIVPVVPDDEPEEGPFVVAQETSDRIQKDFETFRTRLGDARKDLQSEQADPGQVVAAPKVDPPEDGQEGESAADEDPADPGSWLKACYRELSNKVGRLSDTYRKAEIEAPYTDTLVQLSAEMGRHLDQFLNAPNPNAAKAQLKKLESILVTMEMTHKDHRRWLGAQSAVAGDGSDGKRAIVVGSAEDEE